MEPYYTRAENLIGASGKAGNIQGRLIEGGNIFEGVEVEDPTPPTATPYFSALFRDAAKSLGYHPFPGPNATLSEAHTNPDGVFRPGCVFCGFCNMYGCMIGAKAQPTNVFLPVIKRHKNVTIRTGPRVRRLVRENLERPGAGSHVQRFIRRRGFSTCRPGNFGYLDPEQYAAAAFVGNWRALSSRNGER